MSKPPPTLTEQAAAVERAAMNHNGHIRHLRELVERNKRPEIELKIAEQYQPALNAAVKTMQRLVVEEKK